MTGVSSSCGACKFLRRKCKDGCVFAPYFSYDHASTHFAAVHKVFGASNVSKLLSNLPLQNRSEAAITISYEALARMQDPTYGCFAQIFALQQQVAILQEEIQLLETRMAKPATNDHQSSQALNNNTTHFWFSSSFPDYENCIHSNYSDQHIQEPLVNTMNFNGNAMHNSLQLPEQHILLSEVTTNQLISSEAKQLIIGIEQQGTSASSNPGWVDDIVTGMPTQVIRPSLVDDYLAWSN